MGHFKGFGKYAYKKQKPGYELHNFLDTGLKPLASNRKILIGISILVILLGGYLWAQDPGNRLFHNYGTVSNVNSDPFNLVWTPTSTSSAFKHFLSSFHNTNCPDVNAAPCEQLGSNSTHSAISLSVSPVGDLGIVSGKNLQINMQYEWLSLPSCTVGLSSFGWFLTTNSTIPTSGFGFSTPSYYHPLYDPSVVMVMTVNPTGCNTGSFNFFMLRQNAQKQTMFQQDLGGCNPAGSAYTCASGNIGTDSTGKSVHADAFALNYTSGSSGGNTGISQVTSGETSISITITTSTIFPWFNLNVAPLYMGLYQTPGPVGQLSVVAFDYGFVINGIPTTPSMQITGVTFTQSVSPPPNSIDTGGFFGPIIKALISIGIFMVQSILNFIGFISGPLQTAGAFIAGLGNIILGGLVSLLTSLLNTIGGWVGNPNLGTQIVSGFGAIGNFITALLTSVTALVTNLVAFIQGSMLFLFDATNGLFTFWISGILSFLSTLATIAGFIIQVIKLFQIGMPFIVLLDMVWLITETYDNGTEGAMKWWHPHEILVVKVGGLMLMLVEKIANFIYQSTIVVEEGVADIKPEIAGFSP